MRLNPNLTADFRRNSFVVVPSFLDGRTLSRLRESADTALAWSRTQCIETSHSTPRISLFTQAASFEGGAATLAPILEFAASGRVCALLDAIAHRRSLGLSRLKPHPVDRALIEAMLQAANWAPSHEDTEPWRFTVFSGEGRNRLADMFGKAYRTDAGEEFREDRFEAHRARAMSAPVWISLGVSPALNEDGSLKMTEEEEVMAVACAVQNLHLVASAFGLAWVFHWYYGVLFMIGALLAYGFQKKSPAKAEEYTYPIASGIMAGGALMGVALIFWQNGPEMWHKLLGH